MNKGVVGPTLKCMDIGEYIFFTLVGKEVIVVGGIFQWELCVEG